MSISFNIAGACLCSWYFDERSWDTTESTDAKFEIMTESNSHDFAKLCRLESLNSQFYGQMICLSVFNITLAFTAIVGNTLILIALRKEASLHLPSKLLLRGLATSDLCVGILQPCYVIHWLALTHSQWEMCRVVLLLQSIIGKVLVGVSLSTITAISVDRLLALLLGLRYRQFVTFKRVSAILVAVWAYHSMGAVIGIYNDSAGRIYAFINVLLSVMTSMYCYTRISFKLRRHQIQTQESAHVPVNPSIPMNITRYKKTVSSAMWVQLALVFCYLPHVIVAPFMHAETHTTKSPGLHFVSEASLTLMFFSSSLNPILYCWKIKEVRIALINTLKQLSCKPNQ